MTRDEAVAEIKQGLGFRTNLDSQIITKLQHVQSEWERKPSLPDFLLTEVATETTTADEERVAQPSDFLMEWEDDALYYYNSDATNEGDKWVSLVKNDLQTLRKNDSLAGSGAPQAYAYDGTYFRIFPTPDDAYTLKMIYYKAAQSLTTNIENEWLKHAPYVLIGDAGMKIAGDLRDAGAKAHFSEIYAGAVGDLKRMITAREVMGRGKLQMGGAV